MLSTSLLFDFEADVFMCERLLSDNNTPSWNLRLLSKGQLIEAKVPEQLEFDFCNDDSCHFIAQWNDDKKEGATIINAQIYHRTHSKDDDMPAPIQLELFD